MTDRLLDAHEIASLLAVPVSWVRSSTRAGYLPHLRLGRYVRYREADVLAWLDAQTAGGAAWKRHRPVEPPSRNRAGSA